MRQCTRTGTLYAALILAIGLGNAYAEGPSAGPDVIYSEISSIQDYGAIGGVHGYALGSNTCNIGNQNLLWVNDGTPGLGMNAYRLHDNRLEQIGLSWVKTACCGCGTAETRNRSESSNLPNLLPIKPHKPMHPGKNNSRVSDNLNFNTSAATLHVSGCFHAQII